MVLLRARHFGYPGARGSEVINHVYTPEAAIQIWLDSVFHRYPMLSPETGAGGYGEAQLGILSVSVYDFGLTDPGRSDAVVYPAAGQQDVPAAFTGNEVPDPVPPGGSYPVGYPLTLQVGSADALEVVSSKLQGPDGQDVPSYVLLPNQGVGAGEWALLAKQPLQPGKTYSVEVSGKLNGDSWTKKWQFTVTSPIAGALVSALGSPGFLYSAAWLSCSTESGSLRALTRAGSPLARRSRPQTSGRFCTSARCPRSTSQPGASGCSVWWRTS